MNVDAVWRAAHGRHGCKACVATYHGQPSSLYAHVPDPIHAPSTVVRTVLFSDVVGSTAFIDRRGERAWLELLSDHARTIRSTAERHGGTIATFLGDGFMVIFERPCDALACALELQATSIDEEPRGLRIGLDHGEIHALERGWWVGRTIHIASRLTRMSLGGDVVVSDRCLTAAQPELDDQRIDTRLVAIRGLSEPCVVHAVAPEIPDQSSARPIASRVP